MTIKEGFILRKLPGMNLIMPVGENVKMYKDTIILNETGTFIYEKLVEGKTEEEVAKAITQQYDVDMGKALKAVKSTCIDLVEAGVAE